jgi:hypothetical protein
LELLFLTSYTPDVENDGLVDVLDALGRVVKWVHREEGEVVVSMASDLVCIKMIQDGTF